MILVRPSEMREAENIVKEIVRCVHERLPPNNDTRAEAKAMLLAVLNDREMQAFLRHENLTRALAVAFVDHLIWDEICKVDESDWNDPPDGGGEQIAA